jgi:hypothetical protein
MAKRVLIEDGSIVWLMVAREGNPDLWKSGTHYNLGDLVIPDTDSNAFDDYMFQAMAYQGRSGDTEPTFDTQLGGETIDNEIKWVTRDSNLSKESLPKNQYFLITEEVTAE